MKRIFFLFLLSPFYLLAQKKPLDHSVYDGWQVIGEKLISNDGKWVAYTVVPQEGDGNLFIQSADGSWRKQIARGYNAVITEDSRFLVCKIRPVFRDTREARIKKKKPEDMPKDSIALLELGKPDVLKLAKIRSYKTPEKGWGWLAYQKEKDFPIPRPAAMPLQKTVDSLRKTIDSLLLLVNKSQGSKLRDAADADDDPSGAPGAAEGSDLILRNLRNGKESVFKNIVDYYFSADGKKLLMRASKAAGDNTGSNAVWLLDLTRNRLDTILKGGNDFRNFALTEDGKKIAFLAERDTSAKAIQKTYGLYLYREGDDGAALLVDKNTPGMQLGTIVSENGTVSFSKSGNRLFFGTAPLPLPRDTSLVDFETAKLDVWHYNDDYLQTIQLFQLNNDLRRSYLAVYDLSIGKMRQLGSKGLPTVIQTNEGDGDYFIAVTDTGRRIESQWSGATKKDIYALNVETGEQLLVKKNHDGSVFPSPSGKYILLYDNKAKNYFAWDGKTVKNMSARIKVPLYDELNDVPDDPNPYGVMGWQEGDSAVYVYDRYDVWKLDPKGLASPQNMTNGRAQKITYRYLRLDPSERFIRYGGQKYFRTFDNTTKENGISYMDGKRSIEGTLHSPATFIKIGPYSFNHIIKAKSSEAIVFSKENFSSSSDLYMVPDEPSLQDANVEKLVWAKLSNLNPQQSQYNWGTAELYHWKTFDGKPATGILYKPENFDSTKKYPMIIHFYDRRSDSLYYYINPVPTPSRLSIPFFVSRGYVVFTPDIHYTLGHPGKSCYNYLVSGAQSLTKRRWIDAKNIGLQGQSWAGYQIAYLITATQMFKAAWVGAPVVNMFSAYGGIRWESGNSRQSQYEKGQSRIGATPWERPDLYIENSPLFHLKNVTTPLVIMSNDADGAVPWYQGIEFFTAMRRLHKQVWLLSYNGEAHNLVERKNRRDIQVREQEYFDWQLKGAKPAKWLTEGVPALKKGKDWGLELVDQ